MGNVWHELPKPFFILAPMEDVTDTVFRQVIMECGRPELFFTEFTNTDGLVSVGEDEVSHRLHFDPSEKPLIAQIWGTNPDHFYEAAQKIVKMGFDGIDINMGCPERSVMKKGSCAALIDNPALARKIIEATKQGAGTLPVSVKTRIGTKNINTEEWIGFLLRQNIAALTIHGRTAKEMSSVPTHWDEIGKAVKVRDSLNIPTLIIGNGDVRSREEGLEKVREYGVDGVMIGRGVFEDPFIFHPKKTIENLTIQERFALYLRHIDVFERTWEEKKNFAILKKFCKVYIKGFPGASDFRVNLMESKTYEEIKKKLQDMQFFSKN